MRQYDDVLDDFDARTQPGSWWERLLKAYVGYGVADDFCRLAAEGLDAGSRAVVLEVLDDASHAELAVAELDAAGSADGVLTARLALWGRRLVGEALGVVQRLLVQRPALVRLVALGSAGRQPGRRTAERARPSSSASSPPSTPAGWPPRPDRLTASRDEHEPRTDPCGALLVRGVRCCRSRRGPSSRSRSRRSRGSRSAR